MITHRQKSAETIYTRKGETHEGGTCINPLQVVTGIQKTNCKPRQLAPLDLHDV